jgi:hypothetical protein
MADRDYRALCGMEDPAVFSEEIFGFHVQQRQQDQDGVSFLHACTKSRFTAAWACLPPADCNRMA